MIVLQCQLAAEEHRERAKSEKCWHREQFVARELRWKLGDRVTRCIDPGELMR
jgi:hypothetical protein